MTPSPIPRARRPGDRSNVQDAGGNSFVVPAPTDPTAPDYTEAKKAYDAYQEQVAREPLAAKLADDVGHVRLAANFGWTLQTGYLVSSCKPASRCSPLASFAKRTPAT